MVTCPWIMAFCVPPERGVAGLNRHPGLRRFCCFPIDLRRNVIGFRSADGAKSERLSLSSFLHSCPNLFKIRH